MSLIITGIGSRSYDLDSPSTNREIVTWIGTMSGIYGWTLRSGGAAGMDTAFEQVWQGPKEIFIPWNNFNGRRDGVDGAVLVDDGPSHALAVKRASEVHPRWNYLGRGAKLLHARNANQVCGPQMITPSDICVYCADVSASGEVQGGTRTAVVMSQQRGVPTFNLKHTQDRIDLQEYLNEWIATFGSTVHPSGERRTVSPVVF